MATGLTPALEYHVVNSLGWPDLRPLQRAAVDPVRSGADVILLAPTAGGKTEAATFPLLSEMVEQEWRGLSVLYVTPLRALLNNLAPRLAGYGAWLGRRAELWHGDVGPTQRRAILADPPDILLTTPESIEAILVSTRTDPGVLFANLRAVVVDELHAFAGDDRGWHLIAVLERVQRLAGRRLQRIGLSATIGNPDELLAWLGGGTPAERAEVVTPDSAGSPRAADVTLDFVGSIQGAATVIAALHAGEKRLAFCESRARCEELAQALRGKGIRTFVSHSSLSAEERRRSEAAFAEARDCVVVATSTLELGIDVGDLDRVIQVDAPRAVSSFLQRLGRTGRRPGSTRNALFLATDQDALLQAAGLLRLWRAGYVEPVTPPPQPRHIVAQQLLALALQAGQFGTRTWAEWWPGLEMMADGEPILQHLLDQGFLETDAGMAFIGAQAERRFGRRHFMDLTAVFTAPPELTVIHGRTVLGTVSPGTLARDSRGQPTVIALAGRAWRVTHVDWTRRQVSVTLDEARGTSRWDSASAGWHLSGALADSMRAVLLGDAPDVTISRRARAAFSALRETRSGTVHPTARVIQQLNDRSRWWTYAGGAANASLVAALEASGLEAAGSSLDVRVAGRLDETHIKRVQHLLDRGQPPVPVDERALDGLKFSDALPRPLALATLAARLTDLEAARQAAGKWEAVFVQLAGQ